MFAQAAGRVAEYRDGVWVAIFGGTGRQAVGAGHRQLLAQGIQPLRHARHARRRCHAGARRDTHSSDVERR